MKTINDYQVVEDNIDRSKIFRFSYKKIIGESLTSFITRQREKGFNSLEAKHNLIGLPNVKEYLSRFPMMKNQFMHNIEISISARYAEQSTYDYSKEI